jgi:adenylate cyclase
VSDVFISYARSTAKLANAAAEALRGLGYSVWLDDELLAHHAYTHAIEQQLTAAKAALVIWSAEAVQSEWVLSEANRAREDRKLVQLTVDGARLPMPFDQTQCADLAGWNGDASSPGWRKVLASIADLTGGRQAATPPAASELPPLPSKPSIAVMPFANLSGDPEQEYFADGMVEEIARALSRYRSIFVIGGGSGLSFKGKETSPQEVGKILGVRFVLEGSVRKAGVRVRIAVKLIDAADGAQVWADRFEDTLEDVFALQDRVALSVAGVIEPAVREADARRATARPTESIGSYDLALRGMARYRSFARDDLRAGLDMLNRAIALDPSYGMALAMTAFCHAMLLQYGWSDDPAESLRETRRLIERALVVAPDDAEVLATLATPTAMVEGRAPAAALADRATSLNPGSSLAWLASGCMRVMCGEPQLGTERLRTALRLDPLSAWEPEILAWLGAAHVAQRQFAEALPLLRQATQLRPHWALGHVFMAATLGQLGELEAAGGALGRVRAITLVEWSPIPDVWDPDLLGLITEGLALAGADPQGGAPAP